LVVEFDGLFPDQIIPSFLGPEWISIEMWDDDRYEIRDTTHIEFDLRMGSLSLAMGSLSLAIDEMADPQIIPNRLKDGSIIGSQLDHKLRCYFMSVIDRQKETSLAVSESRQPVSECVSFGECGRMVSNHDLCLPEDIGLGQSRPSVDSTRVRLVSLYQKCL
jgi:hypothetical protein